MKRHKTIALAAGVALLLVACSDSATSKPTVTSGTATAGTGTGDTTASANTTPAPKKSLRNVRYCEVLLLHQGATEMVADVYNSMGYGDCPQDQWTALNADTIAKNNTAEAALLNGPRYWTLDEIDTSLRDNASTAKFGSIEMFLAAHVHLGSGVPLQTPYAERSVSRDTVFVYRKGSQVYELTDSKGTVYVMQSYSLTKDATLTIDRLPALGSSLKLPSGWKYAVVTLDKELDVNSSNGIATVVQDELQNTYQRIDK